MIRFATKNDLPRMLDIYSPYVLQTTNSFEYEPPTLEEFTGRFREITRQFPWLVYEEDGRVQGYAYASYPFSRAAYRWSGESSIYLAPEVQGRGVGKALYRVLETLLRQQGLRLLYAVVTEENESSVEFHRAIGYEEIARMPGIGIKQGRQLGTVWLQKVLNSGELPMNFPKSITDIVSFDRIRP